MCQCEVKLLDSLARCAEATATAIARLDPFVRAEPCGDGYRLVLELPSGPAALGLRREEVALFTPGLAASNALADAGAVSILASGRIVFQSRGGARGATDELLDLLLATGKVALDVAETLVGAIRRGTTFRRTWFGATLCFDADAAASLASLAALGLAMAKVLSILLDFVPGAVIAGGLELVAVAISMATVATGVGYCIVFTSFAPPFVVLNI